MATESVSFNTPSNVTFTNAECVQDNVILLSNALRTCILETTNPITNVTTYNLSTTISSNTLVSGQYNGENLVNVSATITDSSGTPVSASWSGSTVFLTWTSTTPDFGSICNYTVTTDQATYTLDQTCYNFADMTFTPNGSSTVEDCDSTQVVITRT